MAKLRRDALGCAAALAAMSCCGGLSSGRGISAFYAQTGRCAWPGIGVASAVYGLLMAGILRLKRRTGACSLPAVYAGVFGRRAGAALAVLHAVFYALAAYALLETAANAAELVLPFHNANVIGVFSALLFSLWLSLGTNHGVKKTGCICFVIFAALILALAIFGKMPDGNVLHFYVKLKLADKPWAAVLLAVVHASLAAGMCAAAAVRLFPMHIRPGFAGFVSAAAFALLMSAGNAVFSVFPKEINALRYPFVPLAQSWGTAGFYIFALSRWLESVVCLCGIFCVLPEIKH